MANDFQGLEGQVVPVMPDSFVNEVTERYIELYEKITGESFIRSGYSNILKRIEDNVRGFLSAV